MLMIQTLQPPHQGAVARNLALPLLRCSQPHFHDGSRSPTLPRNTRAFDELSLSGSGIFSRGADGPMRLSRPSSHIQQRSGHATPRYAPHPSSYGALEPQTAPLGRISEPGKHLGPEPTMHPALIRSRLYRQQLDEQWRCALPQFSSLTTADLFGRIGQLCDVWTVFVAETPAPLRSEIDEIIAAAAAQSPTSLQALARHVACATVELDDDDAAYLAHRLASGLLTQLAEAAEQDFDDRDMPPAKRRHLSHDPAPRGSDTIRHAYSDTQARIANDLESLERLINFTDTLLPKICRV